MSEERNFMKLNQSKYSKCFSAALGIGGLILISSGCNDNNAPSAGQPGARPVASPAAAPAGAPLSGSQIDRLARPAINEGLSITDASLNAFNSIPPSADLSPAAAPVLAEDANTLMAFAALGQKLGLPPAPSVATTVGAFVPDVMRIDTRLSIPPGVTAYNAATSGSKGMLVGGRKLEDDVIDITLSFLVAGDASGMTVKDNVFYEGVPGNPNQPGHQFLVGQTSRMGPATFPFVTTPN